MKITVTAKITAGHHPKYGAIIAGQIYQIDEADFADQLFVGAPHAAPVLDPANPQPSPAKSGKKGR